MVAPNLLLPLAGTAVGAGAGALTSKKHRLRNALIGAGAGGLTGGLAEYKTPGLGLALKYKLEDALMPDYRSLDWRDAIIGQAPTHTKRDFARFKEIERYARRMPQKGIKNPVYSTINKIHPRTLDETFEEKTLIAGPRNDDFYEYMNQMKDDSGKWIASPPTVGVRAGQAVDPAVAKEELARGFKWDPVKEEWARFKKVYFDKNKKFY